VPMSLSYTTPWYRSEVAYMMQMRPGSLLPERLPIGQKAQIEAWGAPQVRAFAATGDLGYSGIRGAVGLGYRFTV
jgi:hypothetical protein